MNSNSNVLLEKSNINYDSNPKIRFSNFNNDLKSFKLEEICTFSKGKGISKSEISEEGIPCIRYGELYTKYGELIKNILSKTNINKNNLIFSESNDILIPCSGETAIDLATASCVLKEDVAIGGDITIIKTNQYAPFITYYINNKRNEIAKYAQGVSIVHLYPKDFKKLSLIIPSIKEQKKIIDFISVLDEKIILMQKTLVLYQKNKKYYLNLFFNENGEFYTNYNKVKLNNILSLQGGFNFNSKQFSEYGDNRVIKIGDIPNNLNIDSIEGNYSKQECGDKYKVYGGDIVIALSGATFGKSGIIKGNSEAFINQRVAKFICDKSDSKYIYQLINSPKFKKYLNRIPTSSAQPNISNKDILNYQVYVPNLNEQHKIGNFLSLIDTKITNVTKSINKLNRFKKGLLQKMFV